MKDFAILDQSKIPAAARVNLRDGEVLSLGGYEGNDECFVAHVFILPTGIITICSLCGSRMVEYADMYEIAEAKAVRHLRTKHNLWAALWAYGTDLKVHPIP